MKHSRSRPQKPPYRGLDSKRKRAPRKPRAGKPEDHLWLWGTHAVLAALNNPARQILQLYASKNAARHVPAGHSAITANPQDIAALLPEGAVHQGLALHTRPLVAPVLDSLLAQDNAVLVMLDGVTDPRNIGAILRSCAAFGAAGAIMQARHMPPPGGVLAKAAAGALERVPLIGVTNLARALGVLADAGWFSIGLAGQSAAPITAALRHAGKLCLVLGAEGRGLRPNVARHCDMLARIPIAPDMESLNVATAAAIALYEAGRGRDSKERSSSACAEG